MPSDTLFERNQRFGLAPKLVGFGLVLVILSVSISSMLVYQSRKALLEKHLGLQLLSIVNSLAPQLDADLHEVIHRGPDGKIIGQEEFDALRQILVRAKDSLQLEGHGSPLYTMRPTDRFEAEGEMEFVVMTDRDTNGQFFIGNQYHAQPMHRKVMQGTSAATGLYQDSEGAWISAAAPIKTVDGRVVAVLQADRPIHFFYAEARKAAWHVIRGALLSVFIAVMASVALAKSLTRPVRILAAATRKLAAGDYSARAHVQTRDELGILADRFNHMALVIETAHAVEARHKNEILDAKSKIEQANAELQFANHELNEANRRLESALAESERLAKEAQAANRAKDEFLSVMSHELRTPMNAILGFTGLLKDSPLSGEEADFARISHDAAQRLMTIINDVLSFVTIDGEQNCLSPRPTALHEIVPKCLSKEVRAKAEAKGLELKCLVEVNDQLLVLADEKEILLVLGALVDNAVKFTTVGSVTVRTLIASKPQGSAPSNDAIIVFTVEDTGPGIAQEHAEWVFSSFAQADGSMTRKHGGIGLGLALAKKRTERMKGTLEWKPRPSGGCIFEVSLPLAILSNDCDVLSNAAQDVGLLHLREQSPIEALNPRNNDSSSFSPTPVVTRSSNGPGLRILVVGDRVDQPISLIDILLRQGHSPEACPANQFAVVAYRKKAYDLVVMSCEAGDTRCANLLAKMRAVGKDQSSPQRVPPAIAYSREQPANWEWLQTAGFVHQLLNVSNEREIADAIGLISKRLSA